MSDIKKLFEFGSCRGAITSAELITFKRACSIEEWDSLVAAAKAENVKLGIGS